MLSKETFKTMYFMKICKCATNLYLHTDVYLCAAVCISRHQTILEIIEAIRNEQNSTISNDETSYFKKINKLLIKLRIQECYNPNKASLVA